MNNLSQVTILYLDDDKLYRDHTKQFFAEQGCVIQTTNSISMAKSNAIKNQVDILLCDLRLDQINETVTGNGILSEIRNKNPNIFLALYTAFRRDLTESAFSELADTNIKVYDKNDDEVFLLNLDSDFAEFMEKKASIVAPNESEIVDNLKAEVIKHLQGVSNQDLIIPISNDDDISIKKLIWEVDQLSSMGRKFLIDWIKTDSLIKKYRI